MKKTITAITAGLLLLSPPFCSAAYVIHLKDGRSFETSEYQTEGDQIKFKRYGGVIGLSRDEIQRIEEVETISEQEEGGEQEPMVRKEAPREGREASAPSEEPIANRRAEDPGSDAADSPNKEKKEDAGEKTKNQDYYKKKKADLEWALKDAIEQYKRAKAAGQDKEMRSEFRRASRLSAELEHLAKELTAKNDGKLPDWWERKNPE